LYPSNCIPIFSSTRIDAVFSSNASPTMRFHIEKDGRLLFEQIVKMDLEGMVCKRKSSPYRVTEKPSPYWIKVKNPGYSQAEGPEELFESRE
jgi:ATP-dependent DNA ligase